MIGNIEELKAENIKLQKLSNDLLDDLTKATTEQLEWLKALKDKQAQIEDLASQNARLCAIADKLNDIAKRQDKYIEVLENALGFYADSSDGHVHLDGGDIARDALAGKKKNDRTNN
jgi:hypothetical protein